MIRFLYEQDWIEIADLDCNLTVLEWLRTVRGRTGTKEGCASGDCGACTVVLATPCGSAVTPKKLRYEAINSCITFLGTLHGKQLLTVESLAQGNELHPAQQVMVDEHGSQCGFCTPGFVMSLYALYKSEGSSTTLQNQVDHALCGNLCRCTGYRPIRQAGIRMLAERHRSHDASHTDLRTVKELQTAARTAPTVTSFHQPRNIKQLAERYLQHPQSVLLAGGTDLALQVTQELRDLPGLIHLAQVTELQKISVNEDSIELGSAVRISDCLELLAEHLPGARDLLQRFGSVQIRNQATIGGNLGTASPIGDLPPLLLACAATVQLQRGDQLRNMALQDYFTGYRQTVLQAGEFIRSVRLQRPAPDSLFCVHKISKRFDDDISTVCMALHLARRDGQSHDVRLAFGGMAAIPIRARQTEASLEGCEFNQQAVLAAQQVLSEELRPISDARASAHYRMAVARNLLQKALIEVPSV